MPGIAQRSAVDAVVVLDEASACGRVAWSRAVLTVGRRTKRHILADIRVYVADVVLAVGTFGRVEVGHDEQFDLLRNLHRVGEVADVVGTVIVETIVAEVAGDARLFVLQGDDIELVALMQQTFAEMSLDNAVLNVVEGIADAVVGVGFAKVNVVADFLLLRVTLVNEFVIDIATEVAVVLQQVGRHLGACDGVGHRNGTRRCGEGVHHPLAQGRMLLAGHAVPKPQADGQRRAYGRTAHEGVVRCIRQGCLHFGQGHTFVVGVLRIVNLRLLDTRVQHLVLRQMRGRRARCCQQDSRQEQPHGADASGCVFVTYISFLVHPFLRGLCKPFVLFVQVLGIFTPSA